MGDLSDSLERKLQRLQLAKSELPNILAHAGQLYFQRQFNKAQWNGIAWAQREVETKRSKGKHLLVASGKLRGAIQNSIKHVSWKSIKWGVDLPYAAVHNYGYDGPVREHQRRITTKVSGGSGSKKFKQRITTGTATVKAHTMHMPKRQFMGDSRELRDIFRKKFTTEFNKVFAK